MVAVPFIRQTTKNISGTNAENIQLSSGQGEQLTVNVADGSANKTVNISNNVVDPQVKGFPYYLGGNSWVNIGQNASNDSFTDNGGSFYDIKGGFSNLNISELPQILQLATPDNSSTSGVGSSILSGPLQGNAAGSFTIEGMGSGIISGSEGIQLPGGIGLDSQAGSTPGSSSAVAPSGTNASGSATDASGANNASGTTADASGNSAVTQTGVAIVDPVSPINKPGSSVNLSFLTDHDLVDGDYTFNKDSKGGFILTDNKTGQTLELDHMASITDKDGSNLINFVNNVVPKDGGTTPTPTPTPVLPPDQTDNFKTQDVVDFINNNFGGMSGNNIGVKDGPVGVTKGQLDDYIKAHSNPTTAADQHNLDIANYLDQHFDDLDQSVDPLKKAVGIQPGPDAQITAENVKDTALLNGDSTILSDQDFADNATAFAGLFNQQVTSLALQQGQDPNSLTDKAYQVNTSDLENIVKAADTNGDGQVTRQELNDYMVSEAKKVQSEGVDPTQDTAIAPSGLLSSTSAPDLQNLNDAKILLGNFNQFDLAKNGYLTKDGIDQVAEQDGNKATVSLGDMDQSNTALGLNSGKDPNALTSGPARAETIDQSIAKALTPTPTPVTTPTPPVASPAPVTTPTPPAASPTPAITPTTPAVAPTHDNSDIAKILISFMSIFFSMFGSGLFGGSQGAGSSPVASPVSPPPGNIDNSLASLLNNNNNSIG